MKIWNLLYKKQSKVSLGNVSSGSNGKEFAYNAGYLSSIPGPIPGSDPWVRKIPLQPTPVFLPGEFHGKRSLEGYSPWGHIE